MVARMNTSLQKTTLKVHHLAKKGVAAKTILVVKLGSSLVINTRKVCIRQKQLRGLFADIAELTRAGYRFVLVISGAMALGRALLNKTTVSEINSSKAWDSTNLIFMQAAAALGQARLTHAITNAATESKTLTAQVLVTLDDLNDRSRYIKSRQTLSFMIDQSIIPVINENDTIANDSIRYGDNDRLSAQVAATINANKLCILSDIDGLYNKDPKTYPDAELLTEIDTITPSIKRMAGAAASDYSRGGMKTKLEAAEIATAAGCSTIIGNGEKPSALLGVLDGSHKATHFVIKGDPHTARKRWIHSLIPKGQLFLDRGATLALHRGNSLLPIGVVEFSGHFNRGDAIRIIDDMKHEIGRGISEFSSEETRKIIRHSSDMIEEILDKKAVSRVMIHRDNMVIINEF